ncbi:class I SAM-dependent methyltransferase [Halieaceae bacterium IMCC8485]|uniref:Class I SAM-dependent methyltransferase n=1 Tax=Candidatus Seongchinamella marina TaxID=2518990 RepID=A0ABT3T0E9_9GAMM|nr:hypothetical protein [Candidatus Seongchinamella marina]MCX2975729.1 class I SAM-dependent methyltransferase [Candidatus Seongchinamella marina]
MERKSLKKIGLSVGTDKIRHHGYHRYYTTFLEHLRDMDFAMLEIGIERGGSLKMWSEYFSRAEIYGIDINKGFQHPRGIVFKGDQSDLDLLNEVNENIEKEVRFIIDDGSHHPEHQLRTFNYLFGNMLSNGGIYILEDTETSYWSDGRLYKNKIRRGLKHPESIVEITKSLISLVRDKWLPVERCL